MGDLFQLPTELSPRAVSYSQLVVAIEFIAFSTLAIASMAKPRMLTALILGNLRFGNIRSFYRDSLPITKLPSIFLLINFVLSSLALIYLGINSAADSMQDYELAIILLPLAVFLWDMLWFFIVPVLTGEKEYFVDLRIIRLFGAQFIGIVLWISILVLILYPAYREITIEVLVYTIIGETVVRLIRSILAVYRLGASWYYIILYFCTLEILPLFVVSYMWLKNSGN